MIPDIRKMYGRDPHGKDVIDFDNGEAGEGGCCVLCVVGRGSRSFGREGRGGCVVCVMGGDRSFAKLVSTRTRA